MLQLELVLKRPRLVLGAGVTLVPLLATPRPPAGVATRGRQRARGRAERRRAHARARATQWFCAETI